ncbi:MAG TPA: Flp family type IVb pilin [Dehalococcoidia bacterium]|nr:Flp family type IVb pilin [Dehalococcoidia bacterium]
MKTPSFGKWVAATARERGQTLTEYGLVVSLVIVFILVMALQVMGTTITNAFEKATEVFP